MKKENNRIEIDPEDQVSADAFEDEVTMKLAREHEKLKKLNHEKKQKYASLFQNKPPIKEASNPASSKQTQPDLADKYDAYDQIGEDEQ